MATKDKKVKKSKEKASAVIAETRQVLMLKAKERGVKNFRVLNKEELVQVLADGVAPERIQEVVVGAVSRWKAGWGTKKTGR